MNDDHTHCPLAIEQHCKLGTHIGCNSSKNTSRGHTGIDHARAAVRASGAAHARVQTAKLSVGESGHNVAEPSHKVAEPSHQVAEQSQVAEPCLSLATSSSPVQTPINTVIWATRVV
jgi:hypothetical protein